ncbi:MAG: LPS export ABC transporter permease LptF [Parvibaculum sp.]
MLNGLSRYIILQTAAAFAVTAFVLTGIIWLTQALKLLDLLISQGQSIGTYFELTMLALPSTLAIILPISLFCAVLYVLNKLISDSEIVVMYAAGVSLWRTALPFLLLAGFVSVLVLIFNLYLAPAGLRELKSRMYAIRGDIASSMLKEGAFTNPAEGLTVYVRERSFDGSVHGILVQDGRSPEMPITYMAETGSLVTTPEGPRLVMFNGNIQRVSRKAADKAGAVTLLYFDKYSYDLGQYMGSGPTYVNEARERYFSELVSPDPGDEWAQRNQRAMLADAHDRIANALFPLAFAFVALAALLPAPFSRRGYGMRLAVAGAVALGVRVIGFGMAGLSATSSLYIPMMYLVPIAAGLISAGMINGLRFSMFSRYFETRLAQLSGSGS